MKDIMIKRNKPTIQEYNKSILEYMKKFSFKSFTDNDISEILQNDDNKKFLDNQYNRLHDTVTEEALDAFYQEVVYTLRFIC